MLVDSGGDLERVLVIGQLLVWALLQVDECQKAHHLLRLFYVTLALLGEG